MTKVVILGAAGAVGSVAARTLAQMPGFDEVVLADLNESKIDEQLEQWGNEKTSKLMIDVLDKNALKAAIKDANIVLNCVGPFYKFVQPILEAVIDEGVDYVDVCDDVDVTMSILEWNEKAKEKGVKALIGMGNSPGVTNLMARFAADHLLDETESVDIYHAHGGEAFEGPGVIAHRFHCMSLDIPMFLDGRLQYVKFFEPDGVALREKVDFPMVGEDITVYPYPHPEQVTIPRFIPLKRVTNKGTVVPEEYYDLTSKMVEIGLHSKEPLLVKGQEVVPYDFAIAYILKKREEILKKLDFGSQRGCVKIVVSGRKHKKKRTYEFVMASSDQALGEGTGIPAAMACLLMLAGKITQTGVYPPEAGVDPLPFFKLMKPIIETTQKNKSFKGFTVNQIDHKGRRKEIDITTTFGKAIVKDAVKNVFLKVTKKSPVAV